jgi:putative lipoic acid-binding regulatory protein
MDDKFKKMHELLTESYSWPHSYMFKFIAPEEQLNHVLAIFTDGFEISTRPSKKGNYTSITATKTMTSPDAIVKIYELIGKIPGVISL